ncbi:MAG: hypothetical protein DDT19_01584 [Syntrophomonadaceae bacterium]|nr:hypothetical protein [Bacillota bacterium]
MFVLRTVVQGVMGGLPFAIVETIISNPLTPEPEIASLKSTSTVGALAYHSFSFHVFLVIVGVVVSFWTKNTSESVVKLEALSYDLTDM